MTALPASGVVEAPNEPGAAETVTELAADLRMANPIDALARVIRAATTSSDPPRDLVAGFVGLVDFELDASDVREALRRADMPTDGVLDGFMAGALRVSKEADRVRIERSQATRVTMPDGSAARIAATIRFDLSMGLIDSLAANYSERLQDARGPYIHLTNIVGIQVREKSGSYYHLYELFVVNEPDSQPIVHLKAGTHFFKRWKRVPLELPRHVA
jgi:hypothetical protein